MRSLPVLALVLLTACGGSEPGGPVPYARLQLSLVQAGTAKAVDGARVVVLDPDTGAALAPAQLSDAAGIVRFRLDVPAVRVRVFAPGFWPRPLPGAPMEPIALETGSTARVELSMFPRPAAGATGTVVGTAVNPQGETAGALIVAGGSAGITDSGGAFEIFDVPVGDQEVRALRQGFGAATATVTVKASQKTAPVSLQLSPKGTGGLAGTVGFGGKSRGPVEVIVSEASTGENVPGLSVKTSGTFRFPEVPPGDYVASAGRGEDRVVPDPAHPTVAVRVDEGSSGSAQLTVVDAVILRSPTNPEGTLTPAEIPDLHIIQWEPFTGALAYAVELQDESGRTVWGGLDDGGAPASPPGAITDEFLVVPAGVPAPVSGLPYRLVVRALGLGNRVLSLTEEQRGWITVVPE